MWEAPHEAIVVSWSGGKDSAMALAELRRERRYRVVALLTTVAAEYQRVSHHGVREALLDAQARAIGVPLHKVFLPAGCTNTQYERVMEGVTDAYRRDGVTAVAFGDIFLEDLRAYREANLAKKGMRGLFPLWKRDTTELVHRFERDGFRARIVCTDATRLGRGFLGREVNAALLADLPEGVDPCGENGEYHSFVTDGPIFERPIAVRTGDIVKRDTRWFLDLLPERDGCETPAS